MSLVQVMGLLLMIGVFVGLVAYRTWQDREEERKEDARQARAPMRKAG